MKELQAVALPQKIALASFAGGTVLFLSYLLFPRKFYILAVGLIFVLLAFLINFITLLYLIRKVFATSKIFPKTIEEIGIILCNIPIAVLYMFIIFNQNNL
jgi:signal transduction histidine kinase